VVFFPLPPRNLASAKSFLVRELNKVCDRIGNENEPYTVSMGISSAVSELTKFRQAYECAEQGLDIGRMVQDRAKGVVTHYEDLGLFRVVSLAESPTSLQRFCQDVLGPLLAYDDEHGKDLINTLRVYLEHSQNLAQTAKALHVHYNTLRYRLERIREILGDVLDNQQQRLTIEVALQFYRLIDS
jgi:purine catabolism regulator